jgi:hypothetical protein
MIIILLLFLTAALKAQFYEYGQDAGKLHWHQFRTPNYRVIFPAGVDSIAKAFACRLESNYPRLGAALDHNHSPMPVIIHNESSFSNGVFVWAPKRLEIFTNPDPNGYNLDWLTQLALHEGRHAVQIDKLNQGFTRGLFYLGGEQLVGAVAVFLPYWYLEGDAVDAETRLSISGRGRQPSFEMGLKAQMLESDRIYSFSKAAMGSYKHYIPNHYELGYLMVRYGRRTYGDRFWIDFQQYAARKPFLLNPTFFSMKQYGIRSKKDFYRDALGEYRKHWASMDSARTHTPCLTWKGQESRHYTSYTFPHPVSGSLLFAYKTGMDQIPEFIFLGEHGQERSVFQPGYLSSGRVSFSGSHIVWDEFVPDTRWSNRNYSVIRTFEIATGKVASLGRRTRYYSPAFSHDGSRIAVIEQTEFQRFNLVILGIDGGILHEVSSPDNQFIQHPSWMEGDTALVLIVSSDSGKSLVSYSPETGSWEELLDAGSDDISYPVAKDSRIYFSGTFSGIDNIYCLDMAEKKSYQVTSERFGAFYPQISADGKTLLYSRYTSNGYKIAGLSMDEGLWKPLDQARDHREQLDYWQTGEERLDPGDLSRLDSASYVTKKYRKTLNLFKFHSWLPLYFNYLDPKLEIDPEHLPVSLGISLVSQNLLSTAVSQVGYEYRNGNHMFHSGIKLKGRYPVVNLFFDYGGDPDVLLLKEERDTAMALPQDLGFTAQSYIPFRFNTGKFLSIVQPGIDYRYRRDIQYIEEEDTYRTGAHYLYYKLNASLYLRKGLREILPRVGLATSLGYYHAPFDNRIFGSVSIIGFTGYLPGLLKHQTVKLHVEYQKQMPVDMSHPAFINLINLPRGLHHIFGEVLTRFSADYVFPVWYPDLEITSVAYLKRIRSAIWADHLEGTNVIIREPSSHFEQKNYTTCGIDLVADLNLFRIPFPLSVGGRFIYDMQTRGLLFEWIYAIDIN